MVQAINRTAHKVCLLFIVYLLLQGASSVTMLEGMKNTLLNSLLILALVSSCSATAALYKGLDSEGNVVYSDTPFKDAENFTPPPISVMDARKVGSEKEAASEKKPAEFKYMSFDIISPENKQTIRDDPDVTVSLKLKPGLNTQENHNIWMLVDGKPVVKNTQSLTVQLGRLDRGAHQLQAQIRNEEGKIIVRTRPTVVFIHKTSAH